MQENQEKNIIYLTFKNFFVSDEKALFNGHLMISLISIHSLFFLVNFASYFLSYLNLFWIRTNKRKLEELQKKWNSLEQWSDKSTVIGKPR